MKKILFFCLSFIMVWIMPKIFAKADIIVPPGNVEATEPEVWKEWEIYGFDTLEEYAEYLASIGIELDEVYDGTEPVVTEEDFETLEGYFEYLASKGILYDKKAKTITFSGTGKLSWIPSWSYYDDVTKMVVGEGITDIESGVGGPYFHGLQELIIPKSVQKIKQGIFNDNYNLKKVYNYSSVKYDPRRKQYSGWDKKNEFGKHGKVNLTYSSPWKWMVDGKEVKKIPPNSKVTTIPKKYHITYDLNGGKKGKGKWFYNYHYGLTKYLPKPERKGYFFAGWKTNDRVHFPTRAFSKIVPTQFSDVKLKAIWRKIKIMKKKHGKGFQVLVSPKKYPQLTMIISTKKDIKKQLRTGTMDLRVYTLAGKGIKSKTKKGMRVFNIKKFGNSKNYDADSITEFEKGRTYYIWFKYGDIQDYEYCDVDEEGVSYIGKDAYYFYKTKITF